MVKFIICQISSSIIDLHTISIIYKQSRYKMNIPYTIHELLES